MTLLTQTHNQTARSSLFRHMQMPSLRQQKSLRTTAPRTIYRTHPSVLMRQKSRSLSQHPWPFRMLDKRSLTLRQKSNRSSQSQLTIFLVWLFMYVYLSSVILFNNANNDIGQNFLSFTTLTSYITVSDTLLSPMAITLPHPLFHPSPRPHHTL